MTFDPALLLPIVADDIACLRGCDVFRLLDTCPAEYRQQTAAWIFAGRPTLCHHITDALEELES